MNISELAQELRSMHRRGVKSKEATCMTHLFGICFAEEIKASGASPKEIVKAAGVYKSCDIDIRNGMKLADYVQVKAGKL